MRVVVTGANGQLGSDLCSELERAGIPCFGLTSDDADITDKVSIQTAIRKLEPTIVVHCAAYTQVDAAEDNRQLTHAVNVLGTQYIAEVTQEISAKLVYISTDYVFAGTGTDYYSENDPTSPVNWYGQTKLDGEKIVQSLLDEYFIVRISWVFGHNGNNFVKTMLRLAQTRDEISVVSDQVGSPTNTADLSIFLVSLMKTNEYGIYHATNEGVCTWAEFATEIFAQSNISCRVVPIKTEDYPTKAVRPLNSRLSKDKLRVAGFDALPHWKDSLRNYLTQLEK
ncbi:dTDP-4-dehydrorhamnose reductase [Erysipelothrix sp. HDW6C]|nr:dTDP-4-dehydrorhamnose reductase [Erysipelothrix sp. HDW6C]